MCCPAGLYHSIFEPFFSQIWEGPEQGSKLYCCSDDNTDALEVPWMASMTGLAAGPPQPACISSFGQTVSVFASKQRPIKITIYGSDFRCARSKDGVQQRPETCAPHDCKVLICALLNTERLFRLLRVLTFLAHSKYNSICRLCGCSRLAFTTICSAVLQSL